MNEHLEIDVILSGNMRSGTTSLNYYCSQHPEIYTPEEKETRFFEEDERYQKGLNEYFKFFNGYDGEETVASFVGRPYKEEVPRRIKRDLGPVQFVFVLRNPVEWVQSMYYFGINVGIFDVSRISFSEFIRSSNHKWSDIIMSHGEHLNYLRRYEDRFGPDNIQCILLEDLAERPHETMSDVYDFVGVDSGFSPNVAVRNRTQNVRLPKVHRVVQTLWTPVKSALPAGALSSVRSLVKDTLFSENAERPEMSLADRKYLNEYYADHNRRLEAWLGRDLSHWS
jgi:hypothetical protein